MEIFSYLFDGFGVVLQPTHLFFCFLGAVLGTLVGVLPGLGPMGAMAILLPVTFKMDPVSAIIMLSGIYYGSMYGGSTTSILVNIPGEVASVVTCLDGYQMALKGRAGPALGISAIGSFIAGSLGILFLTLISAWLAKASLRFGPPEYFSLMLLGLAVLAYLSSGSKVKAFIMVMVGFFLGTIGPDVVSGQHRFTFGIDTLENGIGLVPVVMGLFGLGEVFSNIDTPEIRKSLTSKISHIFPNRKELRDSILPILRGSVLGFILGILPGGGGILASFTSYVVEKKLSKTPERFGHGAIEGVAGPESANNAGSMGAFVPFISMGIPMNATMALLLTSLVVHGITPGPLLSSQNPDIYWGLLASMYAGNVFLIVLNLPLIGVWVRLLRVPYRFLFPVITLFCIIGVYTVSFQAMDILIMLIFGFLGWALRKFAFEGAPLILAMVLGPMIETALRQSLIMSNGSFTIFFSRPISGVLAVFALLLLISPLLLWVVRKGPLKGN